MSSKPATIETEPFLLGEPTPLGKTVPEARWYRNEKGELCFEGHCFSMTAGQHGFDIEWDDSCTIEEAREAQRLMRQAAAEDNVVVRRRRRKGT